MERGLLPDLSGPGGQAARPYEGPPEPDRLKFLAARRKELVVVVAVVVPNPAREGS